MMRRGRLSLKRVSSSFVIHSVNSTPVQTTNPLSRSELGKIGEAINVGPDDQSLWYYHQFLMLNLVSFVGHPTITPAFTQEERVTYLRREIEGIQELLEDYDDAKLIYEALFDYTLYLCQLQERKPNEQEEEDLRSWLGCLKKLDPMRSGRWADLERDLGLRITRE